MNTPRTWFAVIGAETTSTPNIYQSRQHAEAIAAAKRFEYPSLGPWTVAELVEVLTAELAAAA